MNDARVVCCTLTDAGARIARQLPFEHRSGNLVATVAELWDEVDALVLVCATGIAVRAIAPYLESKRSDPAVVCVDDAGRFAIALTGGHAGANRLAGDVAALTGAVPVVTTASEGRGIPALDMIPLYSCEGDVASVTSAWLDGRPPRVSRDADVEGWPLPAGLPADAPGPARVTVTDASRTPGASEVLLRPASLVIGAGASSGADPDALWELAVAQLGAAGLSIRSVAAVATIDKKLDERAVASLAARLAVPLHGYTAGELAVVEVPNPSDTVRDAVGTASVSEAAALLCSGAGASLLAAKSVSRAKDSTVAIARRRAPAGHLAVVGVGPGGAPRRTVEAVAAVRQADAVVGFSGYVDLVADLLEARQEIMRYPIGEEQERCAYALSRAAGGSRVALVCSGDPGVYAMASLVFELAGAHGNPEVTVVPGVTAALSAAALLGAPLGHDHASVSLSDLLTPWSVIESRLRAVAEATSWFRCTTRDRIAGRCNCPVRWRSSPWHGRPRLLQPSSPTRAGRERTSCARRSATSIPGTSGCSRW